MQTRDLRANNFPAARQLRRTLTPTESVLWERLRGRRLNGWKFRRQHPIGRFVLDFYCAETGVAVEIDGGVHRTRDQAIFDAERQALLEDRGIRFLRIPVEAVEQDIEGALQQIITACANSPSPRARGEGAGG